MIGYLAVLVIGVVVGVLLQDSFDVSWRVRDLWDDFNDWRKG